MTALLTNFTFALGFIWLDGGDLWLWTGPYWTYSSNLVRVALLTLVPLLAHAIGGFVSGRLAGSSPGMFGALSAVLGATVAGGEGLVGFLSLATAPDLDAASFSEQAGFLYYTAGLFVVYFPFTVLAGYLGGRLGGRSQRIKEI